MSATAIIVSFALGTSNAVFCTKPMPIEEARQQMSTIDLSKWVKAHPGMTPPNIIFRGHPNYNDALNGKVVDDPSSGETLSVPPCAPLPME